MIEGNDMRIGILGTGTLATALGTRWADAGHDLVIAGRSRAKAEALAGRIGGGARARAPQDAVIDRHAVLLAVSWDGVCDILRSAGAPEGTLDGTTLIDPVNAVEHGVGVLRTPDGCSAAQRIAAAAPGAHVVKAFHMFAAEQWTTPTPQAARPVTVVMCGDDPDALRRTGELVRAVGGVPAVLGPLDRARQLEEAAGFVIGLAFAGVDPSSAVPRVPSAVGAT
ncbi:MAG TPA: NAD(P)-binding domain-containing protein [Euzebyales bacterium]|nr:NAD(P)-binding domain-containing protein [Euzebyales bacterium]